MTQLPLRLFRISHRHENPRAGLRVCGVARVAAGHPAAARGGRGAFGRRRVRRADRRGGLL